MYNLIIIDDEYEIRVGLANYFPWNRIGFKVSEIFESPVHVLDYIESHSVHVILSDIKMPGMTGLELAKKISDQHRFIKLVFISGYKNFDYLKEAMDYHVFNYLLKPVTHREIDRTFTALKAELDKEYSSGLDLLPENRGIVTSIKSYIADNLASTSLEDTAGHFQMNPYYFSRFFKQKTGTNFSSYLTQQKMNMALELMQDRSTKIYHISEMVGYNNSNNFARAFKKFFGKTPLEYRNGI